MIDVHGSASRRSRVCRASDYDSRRAWGDGRAADHVGRIRRGILRLRCVVDHDRAPC